MTNYNKDLDDETLQLLTAAGLRLTRDCRDCRSSWIDENNGIHCGHGFDDSLQTPNPIWGEEKYSLSGFLTILNGGTVPDCEKVDPTWAERCKTYEQKS
jgi:hypothetical protein